MSHDISMTYLLYVSLCHMCHRHMNLPCACSTSNLDKATERIGEENLKVKNNENMTSLLNSKGPCHASKDEVALAKEIEGESKSTKMISKI